MFYFLFYCEMVPSCVELCLSFLLLLWLWAFLLCRPFLYSQKCYITINERQKPQKHFTSSKPHFFRFVLVAWCFMIRVNARVGLTTWTSPTFSVFKLQKSKNADWLYNISLCMIDKLTVQWDFISKRVLVSPVSIQ